MFGAIAGDIAGSLWEAFLNVPPETPLFGDGG